MRTESTRPGISPAGLSKTTLGTEVSARPMGPIAALWTMPLVPLFPEPVFRTVSVFPGKGPLFPLPMLKAVSVLPLRRPMMVFPSATAEPVIFPEALAAIP